MQGRQHRLQGIGMTSQRTRERLVGRLRAAGVADESILSAMAELPRHLFVDEALASRAYEDSALPIGFGQTLSQPMIVARMTHALADGRPLGRVLEVGTGSGYQTALLARIAEEVYSIERIRALLVRARRQLMTLHIRNVRLRHADGQMGWAEKAPFDAILVAAAGRRLPSELCSQLRDGGRMLIPIEEPTGQELLVIRRLAGTLHTRRLGRVSFVPLKSGVC